MVNGRVMVIVMSWLGLGFKVRIDKCLGSGSGFKVRLDKSLG
jgi:hypothetical protein